MVAGLPALSTGPWDSSFADAVPVSVTRGDTDQDHGDRCDERYGHDLQVGRAVSGNE